MLYSFVVQRGGTAACIRKVKDEDLSDLSSRECAAPPRFGLSPRVGQMAAKSRCTMQQQDSPQQQQQDFLSSFSRSSPRDRRRRGKKDAR